MKETLAKAAINQRIWIAIGAVILAILCMGMNGCAVGNDTWYTKASDVYAKEHDTGGMPVDFSGAGGMNYSYTIPCRNASGKAQELTFGSDELIRPGTYLKIETQLLRGVVSWKEVGASDLPADVLKDIESEIES